MKTQPIKILADGTALEAGSERTDHVALHFIKPQLMIHVSSLCDSSGRALRSQDARIAACRDLRVLGYNDWQLAGRKHWERYVLDLTRFNPAINPNLYPGIKPAWHGTSLPCAWAPESAAWSVYAVSGNVGYYDHYSYGFALAVRRVGQ